MIPTHILDQIKTATDLTPLVESRIQLRKQSNRRIGFCPFCPAKQRTPAFAVYRDHYYCHRCGANGTAFDWLMQFDGLDFTEAAEHLAARAGISLTGERISRVQRFADAEDAACAEWWWKQRWKMVRRQLDAALSWGPPRPPQVTFRWELVWDEESWAHVPRAVWGGGACQPGAESGTEPEEYSWADCLGRMLVAIEGMNRMDKLRQFREWVRGSERAEWKAELSMDREFGEAWMGLVAVVETEGQVAA